MQRHDEALACAQKALECEERVHGKNSLQCATIQGQIGAAFSSLGHLDVALSWYQRARAGYEKIELINTYGYGQLLNNIGIIYVRMHKLSEALAHFIRAEAIYRSALPPDHPDITASMNNISIANSKLGNADAATAAAAAADSAARRSQVQCAAADCPRKIKADGSPLDQCGGCKRCYYCSKARQTRTGRRATRRSARCCAAGSDQGSHIVWTFHFWGDLCCCASPV